MPRDGAQLLAAYRKQDALLVRAGWHATSDTWMTALAEFWHSGRTRMVIRKGRQSGFSTTMARVAACTALYGAHRLSKGTRLAVPFVSIKLVEARERLVGIEEILDVLGVATRRSDDELEIVDADHPRIVFMALAGSFRTAVGFTAVSAFEDEMARWFNESASANPAPEVDAAITPMLVTQENARIYSGSSPLSTEDFHAELFARGDTDDQRVFEGPSWKWNPVITEASSRRLQADPRIWSREFAAIPQAARLAAFDADAVEHVFSPTSGAGLSHTVEPFGVIDASSGKKDAWAFGVAAWHDGEKAGAANRKLVFTHVDGIEGRFWSQEAGELVVARVARAMKDRGVRYVFADQREALMLASAFTRHQLRFVEMVWTAARKERAVTTVRRWLADKRLVVRGPHGPVHQKMKAELLAFEEKITPNGGFTYGARRSGHDDYVSLVLTSAMADSEPRANDTPRLAGSPSSSNRMVEALRTASCSGLERAAVAAGYDMRSDPDYPNLQRLLRR